MLLELNIKDFAIIDNLHLRLHRMFNVFTGETGAGKSIIIDAVNALLGGKIGVEVYVPAAIAPPSKGSSPLAPCPQSAMTGSHSKRH